MKTLTTSPFNIVKLTFVLTILASAPALAGGNEKADIKKKNAESTYEQALVEMAAALNETAHTQDIYAPAPEIKIYDTNFKLLKETKVSNDGDIEDEETLNLLHQATEFMKDENTSYYVLSY